MSTRFGGYLLGCILLSGSTLSAADDSPGQASADKTSAEKPGYKLVLSQDLTTTVPPGWRLNHGSWKLVDGAWQGVELADNHHPATARYALDFTDAVIEFDFKFDGASMVQLVINDSKFHVCRVQIRPTYFRVLKDDHDGSKGPDKFVVLADKKLESKPGTWYRARLEIRGPEFTVKIGDVMGGGKDDLLATPKAAIAFVVNGESGSFRNLRVSMPAK